MRDVLSDILDTVELKAALYFRTDYHPPFGVAVPAFEHAARFHLVMQGSCNVRLEDGTSMQIEKDDLVLVPNGVAHILASKAGIAGAPLETLIAQTSFDGSGPFVLGAGPSEQSCKMVCGHFTFSDGADHPLLRAVPKILHVSAADRSANHMLDDVLRLVVRRTIEDQPGVRAAVSRLSEILFIEIMRIGMEKAPDVKRVMSAVHDPQIGRALTLIHSDVGAAWTVESLAGAVGMSRSRFAAQFREFVGSGPMNYTAEWRLQRARHLLAQNSLSVKSIASQVGFHSAAAFTRAFSGRFGRSPRAQRVHLYDV